MSLPNIAQTGTNYVYTWTPDWDKYQHLALEEKIRRFTTFNQLVQADFLAKAGEDEQAMCLIVAPVYIFSAADDVAAQKPYTEDQKNLLEVKLINLQAQLDPRTVVVAGAMSYLTNNGYEYKVTSFIVTPDAVHQYDKKASAGNVNWTNLSLPMQAGANSGVFTFHGRRIGLEICQDHEAGTLKKELNGETVDIHVLIANGQNIRRNHIATNIEKKGLFVVAELQPKKSLSNNKSFEDSAVYTVINRFNEMPVEAKKDRFRISFLRNSGRVTPTLQTTLVKPQSQPIGDDGKRVVTRAKSATLQQTQEAQQLTEKESFKTPEKTVQPIVHNFLGKRHC